MTQFTNRLLASASEADQDRLRQHLDPLTLEYKMPLYHAYDPIEYVHFIESGVGSLVNVMEDGSAAEVGTVGNEGFVGLPVLLGDDTAPTNMYVQVPGQGLRIKANLFREEMDRSPSLRAMMLRYAHAFFNQVAQAAACVHFHSLDQRCALWLLMTRDRMPSDHFLLTQEFLAMMLGVRRAGVTEAAGALKRAGLIRYHHGNVTILDRQGLENRACECYGVTKREFDRLLGPEGKYAPPYELRNGKANRALIAPT